MQYVHVKLKPRTATAKEALNKNKKNILTSKMDLNWREKLAKHYVWNIAMYGA